MQIPKVKRGDLYIGAEGDLNFYVIGTNTKPENPDDNIVWVNTNTDVTGWIFSSDAPDATSEGMIWFITTSSGNVKFNALKTNGIVLRVAHVVQYVDGAWVDKDAEQYSDGVWNPIIQYVDVNVVAPDKTLMLLGSTYTVSGNNVTFNMGGDNGSTSAVGYDFDLTNVKTIEVSFTSRSHLTYVSGSVTYYATSGVGIVSPDAILGTGAFFSPQNTFDLYIVNSANGATTMNLDVSEITGVKTIWIGMRGVFNSGSTATFNHLRLNYSTVKTT